MTDHADTATDYLSNLYPNKPDTPDSYPFLAAVPSDDEKRKDPHAFAVFRKVETADDIAEFVGEFDGKRNIYLKAARFNPLADSPTIMFSTTFCFAWIDIDMTPKPGVTTQQQIDMAIDALDKLAMPPTVIISTGGGIQALWHWDKAMVIASQEDAKLVENINRELARVYGGDTGQCHRAGGLRLPGTLNINRKDTKGRHPECHVLRWLPANVYDIRAFMQMIANTAPLLAKRASNGEWYQMSGVMPAGAAAHAAEARLAAGSGKGKTPEEWSDVMLGLVTPGERNVSIAVYAGKLVRKSSDPRADEDAIIDNIVSQCKAAAAKLNVRPPPRRDIGKIVQSVIKTHERNLPVSADMVGGSPPRTGSSEPTGKKSGQPVQPDKPKSKRQRGHQTARVAAESSTPDPVSASSDQVATSPAELAAGAAPPADYSPQAQRTPIGEYDPTNPAHILRDEVSDWYEHENDDGKRVNAGKEFPHSAAAALSKVIAAFRHVLVNNDLDLLRWREHWMLYSGDDRTWGGVSEQRVVELFTEFWPALTGMDVTHKKTLETVRNMAAHPDVVDASVVWNAPMVRGEHATLLNSGDLLLISPKGAVNVRPAVRTDYLTADECPRIAAEWVTGASAPVTDKALDLLMAHLPDAAERTAYRRALLAWACQVLLPAARPKKTYRGAVFVGDTDTGKTTIFDIMRTMLERPGASVVSPMQIERLNLPFALQGLLGKRAWLVGDVSTGAVLSNDGVLKELLADEPVEIARKFETAIEQRLHLTIGVASNNMPYFADVSDGTLNRLVYFVLKTRFCTPETIDKANPHHVIGIEDLRQHFAAERDGILQMMVRAAVDLLKLGEYPMPASLLVATRLNYGESNRVKLFLDSALMAQRHDKWVSNGDIRRSFRGMVVVEEGWSAASQMTPKEVDRVFTAIRFKHGAESSQGHTTSTGKVKCHRGVWLAPDGLHWLEHGLHHASGQHDKPVTEFTAVASMANRPLAVPKPGGRGVPNVTSLDDARAARGLPRTATKRRKRGAIPPGGGTVT